jgi:DNA invertase Pin-like site-specific DNA recombinase
VRSEINSGLKVLSGEGASIDTTTANGRLVFAIFAGLAEFERELISERTNEVAQVAAEPVELPHRQRVAGP